ncbi:hypothetical protein [Rhizobium leguminosarum]|uniref:hypothetical protein n=1 Tax=Rhizobium leguminosarum TaxID=384 RepID=UPI0013EF32C7|nr:hypothetical protein [Rhizobium leguminosarum]
MEEQAAIVTAAIIERRMFFKTEYPSTIELTPLQAAGLKSVKKWRKSAESVDGILQSVTFVSVVSGFQQCAPRANVEKT